MAQENKTEVRPLHPVHVKHQEEGGDIRHSDLGQEDKDGARVQPLLLLRQPDVDLQQRAEPVPHLTGDTLRLTRDCVGVMTSLPNIISPPISIFEWKVKLNVLS